MATAHLAILVVAPKLSALTVSLKFSRWMTLAAKSSQKMVMKMRIGVMAVLLQPKMARPFPLILLAKLLLG